MKDTFWFQHDSNAQHDERIMELRAEFGWEGYGVFWALVERMRDAQNYRINMSKIGGLAAGMGILKPRLVAIIELCCQHGLFALEDEGEFVFSPSLRRRMESWDNKKAILSESGKRGAEAKQARKGEATLKPPLSKAKATLKPGMEPPLNPPDQNLSREEKRREEESRGSTEGRPASQPDSFEKKPIANQLWPDESEVFTILGFKKYTKSMNFKNIDRGFYLPEIQRKASLLGKQRDEIGWENFVSDFLKRDLQNQKLVLLETADEERQPIAPMPKDPRDLWGFNDTPEQRALRLANKL